MDSGQRDKKWGTIYLDASREATMDTLDAMQAGTRKEQWNQRTQTEYLDRVREKATERAREILGQAYTEREAILEEARQEAQNILNAAQARHTEALAALVDADNTRKAAQEEYAVATARHASAQEEGFHAGIEEAQEALRQFRAHMGASVAGVLQALHGQCSVIFEGWRQEMTALLKVAVEKATNLTLDERYHLILENLVMDAVRQLDDRRVITLRVHPDDEAAVADMFDAARERLPDVGQWIVNGDPSLALGGLVAESHSGTVDSRLELYRDLVEGILQHLSLPTTQLDHVAALAVEDVVRHEAERIAVLAPPLSAQAASEPVPHADPATEDIPDLPPVPSIVPLEAVPHHEPTREELEEELLPIPEEHFTSANPPHVDQVLAQGGFLDDDTSLQDTTGGAHP